MKKDTTGKGSAAGSGKTTPIKAKEQVQQSNDEKIDQDFPGFPHGQATENIIKTKKDLPTKVQEG